MSSNASETIPELPKWSEAPESSLVLLKPDDRVLFNPIFSAPFPLKTPTTASTAVASTTGSKVAQSAASSPLPTLATPRLPVLLVSLQASTAQHPRKSHTSILALMRLLETPRLLIKDAILAEEPSRSRTTTTMGSSRIG